MNRCKLREAREFYAGSTERPIHLPDYRRNYILLQEGLDVIWDGIADDLQDFIRIRDYEAAQALLIEAVRGTRIDDIPLEAPYQLINRMKELEMKLEFLSLRRCDTDSERIENIINIYHNATHPLNINVGQYINLRQFLKLKRIPYNLVLDDNAATDNIPPDDILEVEDQAIIDRIYHHCLECDLSGALRILLSRGYKVNANEVNITDDNNAICILEHAQLSEDDKYIFFKNFISNRYSIDPFDFNYPIVGQYWNRLRPDDYKSASRKEHIENRQLPNRNMYHHRHIINSLKELGLSPIDYDINNINRIFSFINTWDIQAVEESINDDNRSLIVQLSQFDIDWAHNVLAMVNHLSEEERQQLYNCIQDDDYLFKSTSSCMEQYWNLPTNNIYFLQFLDVMGVELPPPLPDSLDCYTPRIVKNPDIHQIVERLLVEPDDKGHYLHAILQLMNLEAINMRAYAGNKIANCLIPHQLDSRMKSARK